MAKLEKYSIMARLIIQNPKAEISEIEIMARKIMDEDKTSQNYRA